jgi:hypothetical protein
MSGFRSRAWSAAVFAIAACAPAAARADAEADAKELFAHGRGQRIGGDCASAAKTFRRAIVLYPSGLGSARNLAECEEQLGHLASARRTWLDLRQALQSAPDPKYAGWDADADAAAARLAPKVARVTLDVTAVGPDGHPAKIAPDDITVLVGDEVLSPALVGTTLERDPGTYLVSASGPRGAHAEQSVTLAAGADERAVLRVVIPASPNAVTARDDPRRGQRVAGWISIGAGAAALVGLGVSLAVRQSAQDELERACDYAQATCDPGLKSTVDRGRLASTLVNVFAAATIIATGTGLALVLASPPPRRGLLVQPTAGAMNGAMLRWRFP